MRLIFSTRRQHLDLEWVRRPVDEELPSSVEDDPTPAEPTPLPVGFHPAPTPGVR